MCNKGTTVIIAGVGGQGTLLSSTILGNAAVKSGYKVRISETFGMSQRGGSVVTHIRIGEDLYSPLTPLHTADMIIGFEPLEAYRNTLKFLKPGGNVILNTRSIYGSVGKKAYPLYEEMTAVMRQFGGHVLPVDAIELAVRAGDPIMMNMVMLGAAAFLLPFNMDTLTGSLREGIKRNVEANLTAFDYGLQSSKSV